MADFYPNTLAGLIPWHANFAIQATATGTTYGLVAGQVTQIGIDNSAVAAVVNYAEVVDAFGQAITEHRNIILRGDMTSPLPAIPAPPAALSFALGTLPGIEQRTRLYAGIIKADADFTPAIGELYGITGPAAPPAGTPTVEATALSNSQVSLSIFKAGYSVLAIDGRINGGAWSQIGVATVATYLDSRSPIVPATPEVREYRVQGIVDNVRVGPVSAVDSAVTVP